MPDLAELLGQASLIDRALSHLHHRHEIVWINGPSGSGKSTIASHIATRWREKEGDCIVVSGDREQHDIAYYPLYRGLRGLRFGARLRQTARDEGAAPLRDVPFVGNTLAFLVSLAGGTGGHTLPYLTEDEASLLSELQSYSAVQGPFLLVADNVHWLDQASCRLFSRLLDEDIRETFSFTKRLRLLFIETDDQLPVVDPEGISRLRQRATLNLHTQLPSAEMFLPTLQAMGLATDLPIKVTEQLYAVTRGHLKLAQEIVNLANTKGRSIDPAAITGDIPSIAMKLLNARLETVDGDGGSVRRLLRIAACIGQTFSAEELKCAYADRANFMAALEIATREDYLRGNEQLSFAHEVIQTALADGGESPDYHAKILGCLKLLRPSDYVARFRHAVLANDRDAAAELAFSIRTQTIRGERVRGASELEARIDGAMERYRNEAEAYSHVLIEMDKGDHYEAIRLLGATTKHEGIVGAEMSYLLALNYFKLRTNGAYATAESILQAASAQTSELELWYRISSSLAVVMANQGRIGDADRLRARMITKLRSSLDPWSKKQRMILHRTASAILPPEAALAEISAAVEYFAPPPSSHVPRYAFQYSSALVNYSGVLFDLGRYQEAATQATKALEFEAQLRGSVRTVERYKVCNNLAIASMRADQLSPADAVTFLRMAIQDEEDSYDRLLLHNNLAVAEALAGHMQDAAERLAAAYTRTVEEDMDPYYKYFVGCNYAALAHLTGNAGKGTAIWAEIRPLITGLPQYDQAMLRYRHGAFESAFTDAGVTTPSEWDRFIQDGKPRFGESWNRYKYGFLLSDIMVWSEA